MDAKHKVEPADIVVINNFLDKFEVIFDQI
jgi:hypothetical protein